MPVYLLTAHAYRSWRADHPKGYVQHGEGLQPPDARRAAWREGHARQPPARFGDEAQRAMHDELAAVLGELGVILYAAATCPTHVHVLAGFGGPPCTCDGNAYCLSGCPARERARRVLSRLKQRLGRRLALDAGVRGRMWFSRGGDLTPVRGRDHFRHLIDRYLPDHQARQAGVFRAHPISRGGTRT